MERFIITKNRFLSKDTIAYFNCGYYGYNKPNNPDFINVLKNTFNNETPFSLNNAFAKVRDILLEDFPKIIKENDFFGCSIVCVPRAKRIDSYLDTQLGFLKAVRRVTNKLNLVDATNALIRKVDTKTTHLPDYVDRVGKFNAGYGRIDGGNVGDSPYPGITLRTCAITPRLITGKKIILIDDIYTNGVNIDEDALEALYAYKPTKVIFYAIGKTMRSPEEEEI